MKTLRKPQLKQIRSIKDKLEIYKVKDFLTKEECKHVIDLIDANSRRSTVVDTSKIGGAQVLESRTSSTCDLSMSDFVMDEINKRMHDLVPYDALPELGEISQGQRYTEGQLFNEHYDYFPDDTQGHSLDTIGQRNWTFMVYLNDVEEGGETEFPKVDLSIKPEQGTAYIWRNTLEDNTGNPNSLHAGRPPKNGSTKYIITKWFRDGIKRSIPQDNTAKVIELNENVEEKIFTCHEDFPTFTEVGFAVMDVPQQTWGIIKDAYALLKDSLKKEEWEGMDNIISTKKDNNAADIMSFDKAPNIRSLIHDQLQPILAEWSGANIEKSFIYGIRSYKDGATLGMHKDRLETHHISCIILVDEDSREDWGLDIQSHDGQMHKIYIKPGQMILYESATCNHGRTDEFNGKYFRNFFVHYKLTDWTYNG